MEPLSAGRLIWVVGSDGRPVGAQVELITNEVILSSSHEHLIWSRLTRKLEADIAHKEALESRRVTWKGSRGARLDDGTPLTEEHLLAWGWERTEDGWKFP